MSSERSGSEAVGSPAPVPIDALWSAIRVRLEADEARLAEEIRGYPQPIPACDAQYNYLLEARSVVSRELGRLREVSATCSAHGDPRQVIEAFISSSPCIDQEVAGELRSDLTATSIVTP